MQTATQVNEKAKIAESQASVAVKATEDLTVKVETNAQNIEIVKTNVGTVNNKVTSLEERIVQAQTANVARNTQNIQRNAQNIERNSHRIDSLENLVKKDRQQSCAGVAGAIALTQISPVQGKKFTVGAGVGTYRGERAVAVGVKYAPTNDTIFSLGGSADSRGGVGAGARGVLDFSLN
ncbi:YadA C-terminal domain-containing protein [Actinobacillus arthritidis]|uniref:YadA C-terminal domain-containing protein n=1 Tax=Actinobacillus arthritidis TaxID=157339 RepID=UPI002442D03A|nr:YadA C-terminal domain-containing protein [Actinobacillus arthritidis]WGE89713.1 YadA C-terminal domain-containing protein [Actinobacillus arthritidis]